MKRTCLILAVLVCACAALAGEKEKTWTVTTGTNAAGQVITGYADPFVGQIDEIAVYTDANITGTVVVVAIDPYSSNALVLATNVAVSSYHVFKPRVPSVAAEGTNVLAVTVVSTTSEPYNAQGEKIRATVSGAMATNETIRFRIKLK